MRKLLKGVGVLALLAAVWLGLVLSEWLPPETEAQREAEALMAQQPPNVSGERNVFAALWLFGYDVPEDQLDEVAAADAAAFLAAAQKTGNVTEFQTSAKGKFAEIPGPPHSDPLLCEMWKGDCLARIRANPEGTRQRLAEFSQRLERGDRLAQYDHHRYGFVPRFDSPIAGPGSLFGLQASAAALDFIDGKPDAAFARLCRDTATWRRLRSHSDMLIIDMLAVAQMSQTARLYAEMLAELSADFVAPCPEVFEPLTDAESNQCAVLRGEYLFMSNSLIDALRTGAFQPEGSRWVHRALAALVNRRHVVGVTAEWFAQVCGEANRKRVEHRDPTPLPNPFEQPCGPTDWAFDPIGCSLLGDVPAYNDYYVRVLDLDGRLKLLQSAIWLRSQPLDGDRAQQFAARPTALQSSHHAMTLDLEHGVLRMKNLEKPGSARGETWEIPYRDPAPASAAHDAATPVGNAD